MKKIIMSLMVIAVTVGLVAGGTFADFSDYEVSEDNYFATGALDLTVSDYTGKVYNGVTVPAFWEIKDAWPCCDKSIFLDLHNEGQGFQKDPHAYIHFKNMECEWVVPKTVYKWIDCDDDGACVVATPPAVPPAPGSQGNTFPKPVNEPEFVAECGGIAGEDVNGDAVTVPGVGCCYGEGCQLPRHIGVAGFFIAGPYDTSLAPGPTNPKTNADVPAADWRAVDLIAQGLDTDPQNGVIKLNELQCKQIYLGQIPNCWKIWVHISLHLQDIDEDDLIEEGVLTDPGTGYGWFDDTIADEAKWDHWPTNAIQKDKVKFDMAFELLQIKS